MSHYNDLDITEKSRIAEANELSLSSDDAYYARGLFIKPSTVTGRVDDVTDMILTSQNALGKVVWTPIDEVDYGSSRGYAEVLIGVDAEVTERRGLIEKPVESVSVGDDIDVTIKFSEITEDSLVFLTSCTATVLINWTHTAPVSGQVAVKGRYLGPGDADFTGTARFNYFIITD